MRHVLRSLPIRVAASVAAAACFLAAPAQAGQVRTLHVVDVESHTRAVLELDASAEYTVFTLQNPSRLVVDLKASSLASGYRAPAPNGVVTGVRTGTPTEGDLRVVFDLAADVQPRSFLQSEGGTPQLILELRPTGTGAVAAVAEAAASTVGAAAAVAAPAAAAVAPAATARTIEEMFGSRQRDLVVAIDAGHGGKDPGALGGAGTKEKNVTLEVARELARVVDAEPGMKAMLTRDRDVFIPLQERYRKARAAKADIFVSIHADASPHETPSGSSVYVLSHRGASSEAARWLADRENAADLIGGVKLDGSDGVLASVLLDLSQSATMKASDDAAQHVLQGLRRLGKTHKSKVEYANFVVLRSPDVPSMLVETAFISNRDDERRLNDPAHRARLAQALLGGIREYFTAQPPPGTLFAARAEGNGGAGIERDYLVARGDTLSSIAARYGVTVSSLRAVNGLSGDTVKIGQRLRVPARSGLPVGGTFAGAGAPPG
ncbi:N-acetylmuramoyl-L-alanine amidase [Coralloluteibacterium stylophorae]|uniref:N-acetylmuramoyl-L-alanine amidase AmiC n=1 Tax=Coralloluteibacterium stylophorae TaxID=1776034 RepID=A0A8J7VVW2_9GAMM|nr:N-acetylmuramoyl-L-alanine amidase [Coralloluteibacterium stylophorae]MBS7458719.1 N-acetylmuramoyl-L-alanine amidase [Coralloluteibacterium stylophorae]